VTSRFPIPRLDRIRQQLFRHRWRRPLTGYLSSALDRFSDLSSLVKTVRLQYFALLREQRGVSSETLSTAAQTPGELYEELRARHPFTLAADRLRVAINGEFAPWNAPLPDGADLVFIPPVAGG
jgi:molybdopterin converting factor small subunit